MKIKNTSRFEGLKFKEIKYMDIINKEKKLLGVLEDLIIDEKTFEIHIAANLCRIDACLWGRFRIGRRICE